MTAHELVLASGLGVAVGVVTTFLGAGGGFIMVPVLSMVAGLPHEIAVATSLTCVALATLRNSLGFWRRGLIDVKQALPFSLPAGVGGIVAASALAAYPGIFWEYLFAVVMTGLIVTVAWESQLKPQAVAVSPAPSLWRLPLLGLSAGLVSGSTGLGAGIFATPLLLWLRWIPAARVVPLVNAMMVVAAVAGAGRLVGLTLWSWVPPIVLVAWFTAYFGVRYQERLPQRWRRALLLVILAYLAGAKWYSLYLKAFPRGE